ncbi:MAG: monovalent cation/H+ antiporter complex subunit F [Thermomicrobiales bacterium]
MHEPVFAAATAWVVCLLVVCVVVMLRSRSGLVRILALDTMTLMFVSLLVLFTDWRGVSWYMDVALVLALLSFMSTIAAARYHAEGKIF